ncbi:hypothetical protein OROGR_019800 [Orobanche gracilis]
MNPDRACVLLQAMLNMEFGMKRVQILVNSQLATVLDWTRGKNLIISSGAPSITDFRGPQDVANLFSLLGLPSERAQAAISKNCRSLLGNALSKKHFHKEAVRVEKVPLVDQYSAFSDWLKWDPISSGEGDLLLDEMEKSFVNSNSQTEAVKNINFTSSMNGLPAHGLQIKDIISVTKAASEPPETITFGPAAMDIEKPEGKSSPLENKGCVTNLSNEQAFSSDATYINLSSVCQDSKISSDNDSKGLVAFQILPGVGQISVSDSEVEHLHALDVEDFSLVSSFATHSAFYSESQESIPISSENLNYSNNSEANRVASEIQSPPHAFSGNDLRDGGDIIKVETPITYSHVSVELCGPLNKSCFPAFTIEESDVENRYGGDSCAEEGVPVEIPNKIESENAQGPTAASDTPARDVYAEGEQYNDTSDSRVKLCDGLIIEGLVNLEANLSEPTNHDVIGERKQIPVTNYRDPGKSQADIVLLSREKKTEVSSAAFLVSIQAVFESEAF